MRSDVVQAYTKDDGIQLFEGENIVAKSASFLGAAGSVVLWIEIQSNPLAAMLFQRMPLFILIL